MHQNNPPPTPISQPSAIAVPGGSSRRWSRLALLLGLLFLSSLACIQYDYHVLFANDDSGYGTIYYRVSVPKEISNREGAVEKMLETLSDQGWQNVEMSEEDLFMVFAGEYPFGPNPGDNSMQDVMPGFTYTIQEGEDSDVLFYTLEGTADFSQLSAYWQTTVQELAVNGFVMEEDMLGYKAGDVIISAEEVQAMIEVYGPAQATFSATLPGRTPVEASGAWDNRDAYNAGTDDTVSFTWKPGVREQTPLTVVRRSDPLTYLSEEEAAEAIDILIGKYQQETKQGYLSYFGPVSGNVNNNFIVNFIETLLSGESYLCSNYQIWVMEWLDGIRTSRDPETRAMLDGLDYGPISSDKGGHLAVILYQRGTDWRQTGTVLDPWPTQTPEAFPISQWGEKVWGFPGVKQPKPDTRSGHLYPHLSNEPGAVSTYPNDDIWGTDRGNRIIKPGTVLLIQSPVAPLVTMADGRRIGIDGSGELINEMPGEVSFYSFPKPGAPGETEWTFFLPEGSYQMGLTGTGGGGEFHLLAATEEGFEGYGSQPIGAGQQATFSSDAAGSLSPLTMPDGSEVAANEVVPEQVTQYLGLGGSEDFVDLGVDDLEGCGAEESECEDESGGQERTVALDEEPLGGYEPFGSVWLLLVCCCCGGLALAVAGVGFFFWRRRKKGRESEAQMV